MMLKLSLLKINKPTVVYDERSRLLILNMLEWISGDSVIIFLLNEQTGHVQVSVNISPRYWNAVILFIPGR